MANRFDFFKRIRLVRGRSHPLTKIVVLCTIVLSSATLLTLQLALQNAQDQAQSLKDQAAYVAQQNDQLKDNISQLGSVDSVERIAEEELGLVYPDSVIFQPEG